MPKKAKDKVLPPALAKRAKALADQKKHELRARGEELIAVVHEKRRTVALAFYEIGVALRQLSDPRVYGALGYDTFPELLEKQSLMSQSFAEKLMSVAERVRETDALRWLQDKSIAVASLLKIEGARVRGKVLLMPTQEKVDLDRATTRELEELGKQTRHALQSEHSKRGRTSTPRERETAAALAKALAKGGAKGARARAVATRPGAVSDLEVRVPFDKVGLLARCLRDVLATSS